MKRPAVYIVANKKHGTIYIGVTSDLPRRILQHKLGEVEGFTQRYEAHRLVYAESHNDMNSAITREKQLKKWKREWKIDLIEGDNPEWIDLSDSL